MSFGTISILNSDGSEEMSTRIDKELLTFGSDPSADVRFKVAQSATLKSIHCSLSITEDGLALLTNKSYFAPVNLNGKPVKKDAVLIDGDVFEVLGKKFKYNNPSATVHAMKVHKSKKKTVFPSATPSKVRQTVGALKNETFQLPRTPAQRTGSVFSEQLQLVRSSPRIRFSNQIQSGNNEIVTARNTKTPPRSKIPMFHNSSIKKITSKESLGILPNLDSLDCDLRSTTSTQDQKPTETINEDDTELASENIWDGNNEGNSEKKVHWSPDVSAGKQEIGNIGEQDDSLGVGVLDTSSEKINFEEIEKKRPEEPISQTDLKEKEESLDVLTPLKNIKEELYKAQIEVECTEDTDSEMASLRLSKSLSDVEDLELTVEKPIRETKSEERVKDSIPQIDDYDIHEVSVSVRYPLRKSKRLELKQTTPVMKKARISSAKGSRSESEDSDSSFVNSTPLPHKQSSSLKFKNSGAHKSRECYSSIKDVTGEQDDESHSVVLVDIGQTASSIDKTILISDDDTSKGNESSLPSSSNTGVTIRKKLSLKFMQEENLDDTSSFLTSQNDTPLSQDSNKVSTSVSLSRERPPTGETDSIQITVSESSITEAQVPSLESETPVTTGQESDSMKRIDASSSTSEESENNSTQTFSETSIVESQSVLLTSVKLREAESVTISDSQEPALFGETPKTVETNRESMKEISFFSSKSFEDTAESDNQNTVSEISIAKCQETPCLRKSSLSSMKSRSFYSIQEKECEVNARKSMSDTNFLKSPQIETLVKSRKSRSLRRVDVSPTTIKPQSSKHEEQPIDIRKTIAETSIVKPKETETPKTITSRKTRSMAQVNISSTSIKLSEETIQNDEPENYIQKTISDISNVKSKEQETPETNVTNRKSRSMAKVNVSSTSVKSRSKSSEETRDEETPIVKSKEPSLQSVTPETIVTNRKSRSSTKVNISSTSLNSRLPSIEKTEKRTSETSIFKSALQTFEPVASNRKSRSMMRSNVSLTSVKSQSPSYENDLRETKSGSSIQTRKSSRLSFVSAKAVPEIDHEEKIPSSDSANSSKSETSGASENEEFVDSFGLDLEASVEKLEGIAEAPFSDENATEVTETLTEIRESKAFDQIGNSEASVTTNSSFDVDSPIAVKTPRKTENEVVENISNTINKSSETLEKSTKEDNDEMMKTPEDAFVVHMTQGIEKEFIGNASNAFDDSCENRDKENLEKSIKPDSTTQNEKRKTSDEFVVHLTQGTGNDVTNVSQENKDDTCDPSPSLTTCGERKSFRASSVVQSAEKTKLTQPADISTNNVNSSDESHDQEKVNESSLLETTASSSFIYQSVSSPDISLTGLRTFMKNLKSPRNDLPDMRGVKRLLTTPKSPRNDLTDVTGVKRLLRTPKGPKNDLTDVKGVKALLKTPAPQKSPKNDLTNVAGLKKLMQTPKEPKQPANDLTDVSGVKKMFASPEMRRKSPLNDLQNVCGLKKLFNSPYFNIEPKNDLTNVGGVKKLFRTPAQRKGPLNDLRDVRGVKTLFAGRGSPTNDLRDVGGIKSLWVKSPLNDLSNVSGVKDIMDLNSLSPSKDELFDNLVDKQSPKSYTRKRKNQNNDESVEIEQKPARETRRRKKIESESSEMNVSQDTNRKRKRNDEVAANNNRNLRSKRNEEENDAVEVVEKITTRSKKNKENELASVEKTSGKHGKETSEQRVAKKIAKVVEEEALDNLVSPIVTRTRRKLPKSAEESLEVDETVNDSLNTIRQTRNRRKVENTNVTDQQESKELRKRKRVTKEAENVAETDRKQTRKAAKMNKSESEDAPETIEKTRSRTRRNGKSERENNANDSVEKVTRRRVKTAENTTENETTNYKKTRNGRTDSADNEESVVETRNGRKVGSVATLVKKGNDDDSTLVSSTKNGRGRRKKAQKEETQQDETPKRNKPGRKIALKGKESEILDTSNASPVGTPKILKSLKVDVLIGEVRRSKRTPKKRVMFGVDV